MAQTDKQIDGYGDSMIESAQRAVSVKILEEEEQKQEKKKKRIKS